MNNLKNKILFLFIFSLALFNSFAYLNSTKIMEWDEARRGVAAYEMLNSGNWFVSTYRGATDYWSTKPPLGLWTIAASYKLFGANRFALRFPSALAAFLTIVLIATLSTKIWGDKVGMVSALVLTTSPPFFLEHAARAGEYDALLALLISAVVFVVLICKQSNGAAASIGILLGLIVLLKSFAVTIPIFILTFYFVSKRSIQFPDPRKIVISIICASLIISFWAIPRALEDGLKFFSALWENDLVARTMSAVEGHERSWYWYITRLFERSPAWMILLFLGLIFGFRKYGLRHLFSNPSRMIVIWTSVALIIPSCLSTKLAWYINPIYPALAILISIIIDRIPFRVTVTALILATALSQGMIIRDIGKDLERPEFESILMELNAPPKTRIASPHWTQASWFVAQVERGFIPMDNVEPVDQCHEYYDYYLAPLGTVRGLKNHRRELVLDRLELDACSQES